jgi:hypothetical protein
MSTSPLHGRCKYEYFRGGLEMEKVKVFIFLLTIISFTLTGSAFSQSSDSTVLRKSGIVEGTIQTGHLIAYGKPVPPPYEVTLRNNLVLVNGIQFLPRVRKPDAGEKNIVVSELTVKKHELIQSIFEKYKVWSNEVDAERLNSRLKDFLSAEPLIKNYQMTKGSLKIPFNDGTSEELLLHTAKKSYDNKSDEEIQTAMAIRQMTEGQ